MVCRRVAIVNLKGGVGKTTVTFNLAGVLSERGERVLCVDMDPEGHLSSAFLPGGRNNPHGELKNGSEHRLADAIAKTSFNGISLAPANLKLADIESSSKKFGNELTTVNCQLSTSGWLLADRLEEVDGDYDRILIDCPPSLGLGTVMSLVAADGYLVPLECQKWAPISAASLNNLVKRIRRRSNPRLRLLGYVINRLDVRRRIEMQYQQKLREIYGDLVLNTVIRNSVRYPESVTVSKPINFYLPRSKQANIFRALAEELFGEGIEK